MALMFLFTWNTEKKYLIFLLLSCLIDNTIVPFLDERKSIGDMYHLVHWIIILVKFVPNWLSIFLWWNYLNFFKGEGRGVRCYIKRQQNIFYSKLLAEDISIKIKWHVHHTKSKYLFILKTLIKRLKYYFKVSVFK